MSLSSRERLSIAFGGRRRKIVAAALVIVVAAALTAVFVRSKALPEDAAFKYQGRVVTKAELKDRVQVLEALYGVRQPKAGKSSDGFNRDAAKSMVVGLVLAAKAADRDIVISNKEAQTELDKLIDQQLTGGREAFIEFLSTSGISESDVLDEIRAQIATSRLVDKVTAAVPKATKAEARKTYDQHKAEMVTPEGRTLVNVVVASKADADRVVRLARKSGKLAPLASTWSLDGSTRDAGGDLGMVTAQQLEAGYAKVAFGAGRGEVYGPVKTSNGWNVGQVAEIVKAKPVSFGDVAQEIQERLTAEDKLKAWRKFMSDVLEDADVQYADDYRPSDPTALPAQATASTPTPSKSPEPVVSQ